MPAETQGLFGGHPEAGECWSCPVVARKMMLV